VVLSVTTLCTGWIFAALPKTPPLFFFEAVDRATVVLSGTSLCTGWILTALPKTMPQRIFSLKLWIFTALHKNSVPVFFFEALVMSYLNFTREI